VSITEPERGVVPQCTSSRLLPQPGLDGRMDPAEQWAARSVTMLTELAVDEDGRLYGHPRGSVGFTREITAEWFAAWVGAEHPAWQYTGMRPADWRRVVDLLRDRVRARDAANVAAVPPDARRAAELAAFASDPEPPEAEPARRGGWMRRPPAAP